MKWWGWWRRDPNGAAHAAAEQQAKLRRDQRMTPVYEQLARVMADLPADELAERVRRAMTVNRRLT